MRVRTFFDRYIHLGREAEKADADFSSAQLDQKIRQAHDSTGRVVLKAREEIARSRRIIDVAEQAVRIMKRVEENQ